MDAQLPVEESMFSMYDSAKDLTDAVIKTTWDSEQCVWDEV